jgi:hypothetical protein
VKTYLKYSVGLIGLYIVVSQASGAGQAFTSGANGASTLVRTFQGR